ncbi:hypothetical protein B0H16DRAFT_1681649 [Mycena metata]|uniref:Uncharacterized protein n=1 Tax=Mycena metata TaxID=1033252 RepID=A0AAD7KEL8_9AGAR|nr:hypothetical protein B0H16DRAFT_1681649 [Mycena metata]
MHMQPFEDSDPFSADPQAPSCIPPADADSCHREHPFTKMLQLLAPRSPRKAKKQSDKLILRVDTTNIQILRSKAGPLEWTHQTDQHASDDSGVISEDDEVYPSPATTIGSPSYKRMDSDDSERLFRSPRKWLHQKLIE